MALEFNADKEILKSNSLKIKNDTSLNLRLGGGADEKSALFSQLTNDVDKLVRVGINTTTPQYELDVEGQIRTTTSIISDTAKINNLDIDTIVNPRLNLKAPNLQSFVDPETGDTFFPTSETPAFDDDTNKVATTNFVYNIATNDVGGRVYVSEQIGNDDFDGRSATKPVRTIKRGAQIAGTTPEKETLIVAGGDYLEDNPISIPDKCSVVGDNIRLCIIRPQNPNKHMFKNQNENYMIGVTFRDKIEVVDGFEIPVGTWDYAYVFDDKQRIYYDKTLGGQYGRQFPIGYQIFGEGIFRIQFDRANQNDPEFLVGDEIVGVATGGRAIITEISYGLPDSLNVADQTSVDKGFITVNTVRGALEQGDTFRYTPVPAVGAVRWTPETAYTLGQQVFIDNTLYNVSVAGTTGTSEPSHQNGAALNGTVEFSYNSTIPQYAFTASNVRSLRPEGEVTEHVTSHPNYLIESCWFDSADPDWLYFRTQQYHTFEEGQWVEFTDLPTSGVAGDLNRFNGRQYVTKRVEEVDGFSKVFAVFKDTPSQLGNPTTEFSLTVYGAVVTSSDHYVKFSLLNSPFKFDESEKVGHRYLDGADLIRRNKEFIADEAVIRTKSKYPSLIIPNETQCKTDIKHLLNAVQYDLSHGGNAATLEAANYYKEGNALLHISGQLTETRYAFEQAREMAVLAIRNRIKYLNGAGIAAISNTLGGNINSVQWINTQFVAVGDGGLIATSPDGQTWTVQTNPIAGASYKDIIWNGNTTIAIGGASGAGVVITSNNGTNWAIAESSLGSATIETIAWDDDEQWVGFGGTQWFSSDNGQEWTARGSFVPVNGSGTHSVVDVIWDYKNTQFVAVGSGGSVYTSPDGVVWTERTTTSSSFSAITGNEDILIAAAGDEIFKSTNGIDWEIGIAGPLVADRYADAADRILANKTIIAEISVNKMLANNSGFSIPTGNQACKDDVIDFIEAMVVDLQYGGNDQTYDAANLYVTGAHVAGEENESVEVFNYAEVLVIQAMRNEVFNSTDVQNYASGLLQSFDNTITTDPNPLGGNTLHTFVSAVTDGVRESDGTTFSNQVTDVTYTPASGEMVIEINGHGLSDNDTIYIENNALTFTCGMDSDATNHTYPRPTDPASQSTPELNNGILTVSSVTTNTFTVNVGPAGNETFKCTNVKSAITILFDILTTAIGATGGDHTWAGGTVSNAVQSGASFNVNHDVSNATYYPTTGLLELTIGSHSLTTSNSVKIKNGSLIFTCDLDGNTSQKAYPRPSDPYYDTAINIDSVTATTITLNVGAVTAGGSLSGVTRTPSGKNNNKLYHDGYQFWISTDDGILYSYDGRKWGEVANTAGLNFTALGSSYDAFIAFETATNKFYYSTNLVNDGTSTEDTFRDTTISNTYEANRDFVCANVQSAIYTYFNIIDTVISGGTAPDRVLPEKSFVDNGTKFVTFARNFLDLPIIEASPYIFNSSVISFLGGSGCEIDGAKVADPNVIRPGLPPQGKSMVAAAFTIISFGGTGYRVINDGYTQLVSVFCIFTFDGCTVETGGYASLTNSASNFGIYALRASGFRESAYNFDIGVVDDVTFDLIGTPTFDIVQLNQEPREHYIIKIDGIKPVLKASENPEYFIDSVIQASGTEALVQADQQMFLIGNENRYTDAAVLIENNKKYIAEEAFYTELYQNIHSFQANYAKCIRDTELIVQAIADDIRDDGNAFTWDAGKAYIENSGVAHITGYTTATKAVFDEAIILCKKAINNQLLEFGTTPTTDQVNAYYHVAQYTTVKPYIDTTVIHDVSSPAGAVGTPGDLYSTSDCANVQTAIDTLNTLLDEILDNPSVTTPLPSGAARNNGQFTLDNSTRYKLLNHPVNLHRPSICNSSSHTWEFSGSGIDYNALPQNGGKRGSEDTKDFEQVSQNNGRVYASGTDELGNFKVGYFANIENRTGNITFGGTVEIEEVAFLKIKGGDLEIVGFSGDEKLGDVTLGSTEQRSDRILATQESIREYITNNYGNYKNKPYGTTPSPGNLVQLGSDGRINIDQIPALRPFNVFTVADLSARLALEGALAGDIAIQLAPNNISYILNNDTYSQILEFTPDVTYTFAVSDVVSGSPTNAQGTISSYIHGELNPIVSIISSGNLYSTAPICIIGTQYANNIVYTAGQQVANGANLYTVSGSGTSNASGSGPTHTSGSATDGTVTFDYAGVAAGCTVQIDNNRVSIIEITNRGSGYTSVPTLTFDNTGTGGSGASASVSIRSRLEVTLIGNIKFAAQDSIQDFSGSPQTITVSNVVNTSAQLEANWVQLTSTNIDGGSITSGLINPSRLANITANYPANSNTYLRGDSTFVPVVSSLRKNNADTPIIINSANQRNSFIDAVEIIDGGENYAISGSGSGTGTLQSQTVSGGDGEGFLADFTVSDGAVKSISVTNGGTGYRLVIDENVNPVQFAEEPPNVIFKDANGNVVVNVVGKAITTNGVVTEVRILDGGDGFSTAPTIEFTGVGNSAAATATIGDGVISRVAVVEGGLNFTQDFTISPLPAAITNPAGDDDANIEAQLTEISKIFNDITIEVKRGDNLTIAGNDFSNLGVWRFYKAQWDFGPDGALTLKEGPGSGLNADLLDNKEKEFYTNADNIDAGSLGSDFLSGEYNIDITGQAATSLNLSIADVRQQTLAPSNAPLGTAGAWKKNADDGLVDGGTDHTKYTSRRGIGTGTTFDGYAITQFAYTDNNNSWIRGSGGNFIGSIAISQSGNGYTPGQYKSVPLGGGEGSGLEADITVGTNGKITDVTITNTGYGYNESGNAPGTFTCVLPQNIFGIDNGRQYDSGYIRWSPGATYIIGDKVFVAETIGFGRLYDVLTAGTSGTQEPSHSSGSAQATSGTAVFDFAGSLAAELTATLSTVNGNQWSSWYKLWSSGNDGDTSGLNASFIRGKSDTFLRSATNTNFGYLSNQRIPSNLAPKSITDSLKVTRFDPQVQINTGVIYEFTVDNLLFTYDDFQMLDTGFSTPNLNGDTFFTINLYTETNVNQGTINVLSVTPVYEAEYVWEFGYSNITAVDFDPETVYQQGDLVYVIIAGTLGEDVYLYEVTVAGESGTTSLNHTSGAQYNGTAEFRFVSRGIPPSREVQFNNNIYETDDFIRTPEVYANNQVLGVGTLVIANQNLYEVNTAGTTSASGNGPSHTTGAATDGSVGFTYVSPRPNIIPIHGPNDGSQNGVTWTRASQLSHTKVQAELISGILNETVVKFGTAVEPATYYPISDFGITSLDTYSIDKHRLYADGSGNPVIALGNESESTSGQIRFFTSGNEFTLPNGDSNLNGYDVRILASGGTSTVGTGTINFQANAAQVNGNNIWHAGNITFGSGIDSVNAAYDTQADGKGVIRDSNGDIGFRNAYGDLIGIASENLPLSGGTLTGQLKQEVTSSTAWTSVDNSSIYRYTPYPQELAILNSEAGNSSTFTSLYLQAGRASDGARYSSARITAVKSGDYRTDLVFGVRDTDFYERIRIRYNGNVGIGVTAANISSKLTVNATGGGGWNSNSNTAGILFKNFDEDGGYPSFLTLDNAYDRDIGIGLARQGNTKWVLFNDGATAPNDILRIANLQGDYVFSMYQRSDANDVATSRVGMYTGSSIPTHTLTVNGTFSAKSKSFLIDHPTKENYKLQHGSLEGPEHGVYVRGRVTDGLITLPDYWLALVDEDTITVQLTGIGDSGNRWVVDVADNTVTTGGGAAFYFVQAERKDVPKMEVEMEIEE